MPGRTVSIAEMLGLDNGSEKRRSFMLGVEKLGTGAFVPVKLIYFDNRFSTSTRLTDGSVREDTAVEMESGRLPSHYEFPSRSSSTISQRSIFLKSQKSVTFVDTIPEIGEESSGLYLDTTETSSYKMMSSSEDLGGNMGKSEGDSGNMGDTISSSTGVTFYDEEGDTLGRRDTVVSGNISTSGARRDFFCSRHEEQQRDTLVSVDAEHGRDTILLANEIPEGPAKRFTEHSLGGNSQWTMKSYAEEGEERSMSEQGNSRMSVWDQTQHDGERSNANECNFTPSKFRSITNSQELTTVKVKNYPRGSSMHALVKQLAESGYVGGKSYDFLYYPKNMKGAQNSGCAIINFRTPELARSFHKAWHNCDSLSTSKKRRLMVAYARVQGKDESIRFICSQNRHLLAADKKYQPIVYVGPHKLTFLDYIFMKGSAMTRESNNTASYL